VLLSVGMTHLQRELHTFPFLDCLLPSSASMMMRLLFGGLLLGICQALTAMPPLANTADHLALANKAMEYFDKSSDPFLAVQTSIDMLLEAGFEELDDIEPYAGKVIPGGRYFFTRNKSTLVAFAVGKDYQSGEGGFKVIGGHTDSPNLRVKPRSKRSAKSAPSIQIGVECYGGGLWHTWFDRDLGISGRVFLRKESGGIEQKLIKIDRAILRVPNLAIHLQSEEERKGFSPNKEDHLSPILAMAAKKGLSGNDDGNDDETQEKKKEEIPKDGWVEHQEPLLLKLLAAELDVEIEEIVDFELSLFDIQKAALGGFHSGEIILLVLAVLTLCSVTQFIVDPSTVRIHSLCST
jgi:aspartyl aminopeptidase